MDCSTPLAKQPETFLNRIRRLTGSALDREIRHFETNELFRQSSEANPDPIVVLNAQRQVVFANPAFYTFCRKEKREVLGRRFGEIIACENAPAGVDGCGTGPQCALCGALHTILNAQRLKVTDRGQCRIGMENGDLLELDVQTTPYCTPLGDFLLFNLREVGEWNRRKAMEQTFFHDLLNTASALRGVTQLIEEGLEDRELPAVSSHLAEELIEEIHSQQTLLASKSGDLQVKPKWISFHNLLRSIEEFFVRHQVAHGKHLEIFPGEEDDLIETDPALLRRVLVNIVKNALEASARGDRVLLTHVWEDDHLVCEVHNPAVISPRIQEQIFQPDFSTKGEGRGLGTHSMRILGESHLGGRITFSSDEQHGTIFRLSLPRRFKRREPSSTPAATSRSAPSLR